jgi:hypothetical protein
MDNVTDLSLDHDLGLLSVDGQDEATVTGPRFSVHLL